MNIKVGQIWSHYKAPNKRYEILALAKDSDTLEDLVVYKALYQGRMPFGQIWVRPSKEFFDIVKHNDEKIQRFKLIEE